MEKNAEKIFSDLKEDISIYAGLKIRLLKLTAIEKIAKLVAVLSHGIILSILAFFTLLFLFSALGFYLGELLESAALGFLIDGGICLLLALILWWAKCGFRIKVMNVVIEAIESKEENKEEKDHES